MLDAITLLGANNAGNDTDFDAWTKANRVITEGNQGQLQGFKNRLINGAMAIDQRVTTNVAVGVAASIFGADRWMGSAAGAAITMTRSAINPALAGYRWMLQFNGAVGNTNITARQRIEAENSADLAGRTVALSFWVYHTTGAARQPAVSISRANAADNFGAITVEGSFTSPAVASGVWTRVVGAITLSANATTGIEVTISSNGAVLAGQVFQITGVQLEPGQEDTAFEYRPVSIELSLCQRYYEKSYALSVAPGAATLVGTSAGASNFSGGAAHVRGMVFFKTQKRAIPAITYRDAAGNVARASTLSTGGLVQVDNNNILAADYISDHMFQWGATAAASTTPVIHWVADAEV